MVLVEKVPESPARVPLLDLVESEVRALRRWEIEARRDWTSFVFAVLTAPSMGYLTLWLIEQDHWWTWFAW